jgi:hypothetical protein
MEAATEQKQTLNCDEVAKVAWSIWQQEGCPHGRDQEHWLKAEQQVLAASNGQNGQNGEAGKSPAKRRAARAAARRAAAI